MSFAQTLTLTQYGPITEIDLNPNRIVFWSEDNPNNVWWDHDWIGGQEFCLDNIQFVSYKPALLDITVADHSNPSDHVTVTGNTAPILYVPGDSSDTGHVDLSAYFVPETIDSNPAAERILVIANADHDEADPVIGNWSYAGLQGGGMLHNIALPVGANDGWFLMSVYFDLNSDSLWDNGEDLRQCWIRVVSIASLTVTDCDDTSDTATTDDSTVPDVVAETNDSGQVHLSFSITTSVGDNAQAAKLVGWAFVAPSGATIARGTGLSGDFSFTPSGDDISLDGTFLAWVGDNPGQQAPPYTPSENAMALGRAGEQAAQPAPTLREADVASGWREGPLSELGEMLLGNKTTPDGSAALPQSIQDAITKAKTLVSGQGIEAWGVVFVSGNEYYVSPPEKGAANTSDPTSAAILKWAMNFKSDHRGASLTEVGYYHIHPTRNTIFSQGNVNCFLSTGNPGALYPHQFGFFIMANCDASEVRVLAGLGGDANTATKYEREKTITDTDWQRYTGKSYPGTTANAQEEADMRAGSAARTCWAGADTLRLLGQQRPRRRTDAPVVP